MTLIIIQCLRCWETGRLEIILKRKPLPGLGNTWSMYLRFLRTGYMLLFLRAIIRIISDLIRRRLNNKNYFYRKIALYMLQRRKIFGKWVKQVHVDPAQRFILT